MEKLVIDSSVVIKWFVPEPYSTEARHLLKAYQTGAITLLAPDLLYIVKHVNKSGSKNCGHP